MASLDVHVKRLKEVCRIGGIRFSRLSRPTRTPVVDVAGEIKSCFGVDVSGDDGDVHPDSICLSCFKVIQRFRKAEKSMEMKGGGCGSVVMWEPHKRTSCEFCEEYSRPGRRPAKHTTHTCTTVEVPQTSQSSTCTVSQASQTCSSHASAQGKQVEDKDDVSCGVDVGMSEVEKLATPSFQAQFELDSSRFTHDVDYACCPICRLVVERAVETPCKHVFCTPCIMHWLSAECTCPFCRMPLTSSTLISPHPLFTKGLSSMQIHCDFYISPLAGCQEITTLCDLCAHVNVCSHNPSTPYVPLPSTITPSSTVRDVLSCSASHLKGDVSCKLLNHMVQNMSTDGTLEVRASARHGRPQVWMRTTGGTKPAEDVTARTLQRRNNEISRLSTKVCGSEDSAKAQAAVSLKGMSKSERDHLLGEAGITPTGPQSGAGLALKADMHMTWHSIRKLRVWLKEFGVFLESERSMRAQIKDDLPFQFTAEKVPMVDKHGNVHQAPMVAITDLISLVTHYLDGHFQENNLIWHDGAIPEDKIMLKVGGDHGGGSFKLSFQIANCRNPNSLKNTIPFLIFEAKDSPANMATAFSIFQEQISTLNGMQWKAFTIQVVLFGDYEFQTHNYGLSGSSGAHPCLHCVYTKKEFQVAPADRTSQACSRSLDSLRADHTAFKNNGGNLARAKLFNNVVRPCLLPVPVSDACIPALHLDLGIFPYIYECLQADGQAFDLKLSAHTSVEVSSDTSDFHALAQKHSALQSKEKELADITTKAADILQQIAWFAMHLQQIQAQGVLTNIQTIIGTAQLHHANLDDARKKLQQERDALAADIQHTTVKDGPCMLGFEAVLQKHHICRQQYHGGAFVGNHVHRALQVDVITELTSVPKCVVENLHVENADVKEEATTLASRYNTLFSQFGACREIYALSRKVSEDDILALQSNIMDFMCSVRREIVLRGLGNVTPKLHLLEDHVVEQMAHFQTGLGLYGEQGGEGLHAEFNLLARRHGGVACPVQRLLTITKQHFLSTVPSYKTPSAPPRKKAKTQ